MGIVSSLVAEAPLGGNRLLAGLVLIVGVLLGLRVYRGVRRRRRVGERVLILGGCSLAGKLIEEIEAQPRCRYSILGVVDDATAFGKPAFRCPRLGPLEQLSKIVKEVRPDRIIVALAEPRRRLAVNQLLVARMCDGILVEDGVEVYERLTGKLAIEALTPSSLVFDKDFQKSRLALAVGRAVSLVASAVGLVALLPLLGLIALAIKLDSGGPVFFVHERVGLGRKPFKVIKFRTMHSVDREAPLWFLESANRVTRVGRWLRKFRLDELPQFLNVLRGDMNVVGPRPQRVPKFALLDLVARNTPESGEAIPYYSLRSRVRPGITGWAQVRYHYAHTLEEEIEKLRYDLYYIKHMSLFFDLCILFRTVKMVLLGCGSSQAAAYRNEAWEGRSEAADSIGSSDRRDARVA